MNVYERWIQAKEEEAIAIKKRREIEDEITKKIAITNEWEGSYSYKSPGYKIIVKRAFTRKVDDKKLTAITNEYGLQDYLSTLFRWKPEINLKAWKDTEPSVIDKLAQAVTTTPGRVSFKIEEEEK